MTRLASVNGEEPNYKIVFHRVQFLKAAEFLRGQSGVKWRSADKRSCSHLTVSTTTAMTMFTAAMRSMVRSSHMSIVYSAYATPTASRFNDGLADWMTDLFLNIEHFGYRYFFNL